MANTVLIISGSTWALPADCPVGTQVVVETWGGGSGGTGRLSSTFGAAGGGGAYAKSIYTITPTDVATGTIALSISPGSAGTSGSASSTAADTAFSTNVNILPNTTNQGAVVGAPGTLPTGWSVTLAGLTQEVVGFGTEATTGLPYIDIKISGTTTGTAGYLVYTPAGSTGNGPVLTPSTAYVSSAYVGLAAGTTTNITSGFRVMWDEYNGTTYVATRQSSLFTPSSPTLVRYNQTTTVGASTTRLQCELSWTFNTGVAINFTLRVAGLQFEAGASPTAYRSAPGYTQADGGAGATSATAFGAGGLVANSIGFTTRTAGGSGAAYNVNGSGAGGAAGKDGAGVAGNTSGQGGQGDATTGGLGGAVKATTPGNVGVANVEGAGGGGGLKTVSGTGGAGGFPGGGGGGAAVATSTGGAGAAGQIRLTYTPGAVQQWSTTHSSASITISGAGLIATNTAGNGVNHCVFASNGFLAGKYYYELVPTVNSGSTMGTGIGNTAGSTADAAWLGQTSASLQWAAGGNVINNNSTLGTWATWATGNTLCYAVDMDNHQIWGRVAGGNWNNSGVANPATNTGGITIPVGVYAAPVVPAAVLIQTGTPNDAVTVKFDSNTWSFAAPSGFGAFDVSAGTPATAAAPGSSTATALSVNETRSDGAATGTSTAAANIATQGVAAATATSTTAAVGTDQARSPGAATASSTAAGLSQAQIALVAAASASSTAAALGSDTTASVGAATGAATVAALGNPSMSGIGAATTASTAASLGSANSRSVSAATGTSASAATGSSTTGSSAIASSVATSTAAALALSEVRSPASATGVATAPGIGFSPPLEMVGSASGTSTADGLTFEGQSIFALGEAFGIAFDSVLTQAEIAAEGDATGLSQAFGIIAAKRPGLPHITWIH